MAYGFGRSMYGGTTLAFQPQPHNFMPQPAAARSSYGAAAFGASFVPAGMLGSSRPSSYAAKDSSPAAFSPSDPLPTTYSTKIPMPSAVEPLPTSYVAKDQLPFPKPANAIPTSGGIEHLEPSEVYQLLQSRRCGLIDLRTYDRGAGLIPGARYVPSGDFPTCVPQLVQQLKHCDLVVFTCQYSAHRAPQCANWYKECSPPNQRVAVLTGGFRGWEAAGLPVQNGESRANASAPGSVQMKSGAAVQNFGYGGAMMSSRPGTGYGASIARPLPPSSTRSMDYDRFALEAGARLAASVKAPSGHLM